MPQAHERSQLWQRQSNWNGSPLMAAVFLDAPNKEVSITLSFPIHLQACR